MVKVFCVYIFDSLDLLGALAVRFVCVASGRCVRLDWTRMVECMLIVDAAFDRRLYESDVCWCLFELEYSDSSPTIVCEICVCR